MNKLWPFWVLADVFVSRRLIGAAEFEMAWLLSRVSSEDLTHKEVGMPVSCGDE